MAADGEDEERERDLTRKHGSKEQDLAGTWQYAQHPAREQTLGETPHGLL